MLSVSKILPGFNGYFSNSDHLRPYTLFMWAKVPKTQLTNLIESKKVSCSIKCNVVIGDLLIQLLLLPCWWSFVITNILTGTDRLELDQYQYTDNNTKPIYRYRLGDYSNRCRFLEIDPYRYRYIGMIPMYLYDTDIQIYH